MVVVCIRVMVLESFDSFVVFVINKLVFNYFLEISKCIVKLKIFVNVNVD